MPRGGRISRGGATIVTKGTIIDGLHRLGLGPGSMVVVHSSLRSFGCVFGGAETVIAALQETVTVDGLVIMPVHAYCLCRRPNVRPFDPALSPAETGRIPETFRRQPGVVRSLHPTHSQAAWGRRAQELLADHENRGAAGVDSPLHRAALWGGAVLQLGVGHGSNTTLHVAEALAGAAYLRIPTYPAWGDKALVRRPGGAVEEVAFVNGERPGCSSGFPAIEPLLEARGLSHRTMIGNCRAVLTPAWPLIEVAVEALRHDPAFLLCRRDTCEHCTRSRAAVLAMQRAMPER